MALTTSPDKILDRPTDPPRQPERFLSTTCPPRLDQPPSREAGLAELDKLNISTERRRILNLLFAKAWPVDRPSSFRPESWTVLISIKELGSAIGELKRTAAKEHLDSLVASDLVNLVIRPGKPHGCSINWRTIYGIPGANQALPNPSAPSGGGGGVADEKPEGSEGSNRRGRRGDRGGVNRHTRRLESAIVRGANHIARTLKGAIIEAAHILADRPTPPEGAEGWKAPNTPPAPPTPPDSLIDCLNDTSSLTQSNHSINQAPPPPPPPGGPEGWAGVETDHPAGGEVDSTGLELGTPARSGKPSIEWPFKTLYKKHLTGPDVLKLFEFAVKEGYVEPGDESRLEFVTKAVHCASKGDEPGGLFSWMIATKKGFDSDAARRIAKSLLERLLPSMPKAARPVVPRVSQDPIDPSLTDEALAALPIERQRELVTGLFECNKLIGTTDANGRMPAMLRTGLRRALINERKASARLDSAAVNGAISQEMVPESQGGLK